MARKTPKPLDKIMMVRSKLDMFVRYGEHALGEQPLPEFIADVRECYEHLMNFRNIINGMVSFDEEPERAALYYVSEDKIREVLGG